jgi:hypothetical protein
VDDIVPKQEIGMARPEHIQSDITLEIGDNLPPERFLSAVRAFFGCVEEVGKSIVNHGDAPRWTVTVREGSAFIGMDPAPRTDPAVVRQIYARIEHGVSSLAAGRYDDAMFSEAAIRHLKLLAEIGDMNRKQASPVRLWVEGRPAMIGAEIAAAIRADSRAGYSDFGTIEGKLEAIQDKAGLQLRIRDPLLNLLVQCHVAEELLSTALESFRKRVEASGIIRYRKNGTPISIDAERIEALPDDDSLPGIDDVCGILSA